MVLLLTAVVAACTDPTYVQPVIPETETPPACGGQLLPAGMFRFTVTGIGTSEMSATATQIADAEGNAIAAGAQGALNLVTALQFEAVSVSTFTEGARTQGGQRYLTFTYRVRNNSGAPISNLHLIPNTSASTISGTPWLTLKLFNGANADPAIAQTIVPTGAVALNESFRMVSIYPDVINAFTEAEIAALVPPAGVTGFFPYGFVVRNRLNPNTRLLPATADPNEFAGILTFAWRFPQQATAAQDPFSLSFDAIAYQDTETRVTESIEEGQDAAAITRLRNLATALAATTTTVLNGSSAMDPAVPDYPGQRQICGVRTAGTSGAPTSTITRVGAYTTIGIYYPGEVVDACAAYFRSGSPSRPATNVAYTVTMRAMDRYGNVKTAITELAELDQVSGPTYTVEPAANFVAGERSRLITYTDYGTSVLAGIGTRLQNTRLSPVLGVTRTWTAGAGTTDWHTNNNWSPAAVPMQLDSVYIPVAAPLDPILAANV